MPRNTLTSRQRQSQQIMRQKTVRKIRKAIFRKFVFIGGGLALCVVTGASLWLWKSGRALHAVQTTIDGGYVLTARAGFAVQSLYLEGRNRTPMEEITRALSLKKGDPIFRVSIRDMRER